MLRIILCFLTIDVQLDKNLSSWMRVFDGKVSEDYYAQNLYGIIKAYFWENAVWPYKEGEKQIP